MRRWPSLPSHHYHPSSHHHHHHHPSPYSTSSPHIPYHHILLPPPPTVIDTATVPYQHNTFSGNENAAGGSGGIGWLGGGSETVRLEDFGMPHHPVPAVPPSNYNYGWESWGLPDSSLPHLTELPSSSAPPTAAPEAEVDNTPVATVADGAGGEEVRRTKGVQWSLDEHKLFLLGLTKYKKGNWKSISRHYVITRSPSQVASHAQKYFLRRQQEKEDGRKVKKRRSSIHDVTHVDESSVRELIDKGLLTPPPHHSHEQVNNTTTFVQDDHH